MRRAAGRFGDSPRRTNQSREVAGGRRRRGRCGFVAWGEPVTGDFKIAARGTDRDRAGAYEFTRLKDGLIDAERHGQTRRALEINARSYSSVHSILKNGLESKARTRATEGPAITHNNIRGADYFH